MLERWWIGEAESRGGAGRHLRTDRSQRSHAQKFMFRERFDLGLAHCYHINGLAHRIEYLNCVAGLLPGVVRMLFYDSGHISTTKAAGGQVLR